MSKKRVVRKKLFVRNKSDVKHISPSKELIVVVNSGGDIDVGWMNAIPNSIELVSELNIYLRGKRRSRGTANTVLFYFKYIAEHKLAVNAESVERYREYLDRDKSIGSNTRSQYYGATVAFLKKAMSAGVLIEERLPKNFDKGSRTTKESFSDLCRSEVIALVGDDDSELAPSPRGLDKEEAASLDFASASMDLIRAYSESEVRKTIADWEFVFSLTENISKKQLSKLKKIDFQQS